MNAVQHDCEFIRALFVRVRTFTEELARPLTDADATIQSMADASPAKWHLAHTTWFFETFILRAHAPGYRLHQPSWPYLFNSYYEAEGNRLARPARGMLSRPTLAEILDYRQAVNAALLEALPTFSPQVLMLVQLGCHHEQQHQELLLTDILHAFSCNPLEPALWSHDEPQTPDDPGEETPPIDWISSPGGLVDIGHAPSGASKFAFDCEGPRHKTYLEPFRVADRLVTNGEWLEFIADGGYRDPRLWLSDGWTWVQREAIEAPLYWRQSDNGQWTRFTLAGRRPVEPSQPVTHISLYEADAFASWAGARLPTEAEWEISAAPFSPERGQAATGPFTAKDARGFFGRVWQWTGSAYRPYPGFRIADGAIGEYNGKFMSGQFVLRGASHATPCGHSRATYRNFFYPHHRWQFTGLRLARDGA
ncbi:ergothioneine biosynthesis protein EgtB [Novosphingobium profundi]|uniref:ergothioneine biosynthesis protein EgtB n=1 Tax=Novosphingobium profundi TaxID=1774954 RepID=UPI001BDB5018|nr:ergothioneine biosynthesis protein EgtB [Novosphingobium profundi]MBT0667322.1 ergothioneine biosynthesis protein EgtB [Novosphingobium profundi]